MRKSLKLTATLGLAVTLILGGSAAANAVTAYPAEGGVWNYGFASSNPNLVFSNYRHMTKVHKATACNSSSCSGSGWKAKELMASATIKKTSSGNKSYYAVK